MPAWRRFAYGGCSSGSATLVPTRPIDVLAPLGLAFAFDLDAAASPRLVRRRLHHDFQNAVLEVRLRALGDSSRRQRNHAVEGAVAAFACEDALTLFLMVVLALALNRERIVADLDRQVFPRHSRDVGPDNELVAALKRFYGRGPIGVRLPMEERGPVPPAAPEISEETIHVFFHAPHEREWTASKPIAPFPAG